MELRSVSESQKPERTDWHIIFNRPSVYHRDQAQAIVRLAIKGDEVTSYVRALDLPESWQRERSERQSQRSSWALGARVIEMVLLLLAVVTLLTRSPRNGFKGRAALPWMLLVAGGLLIANGTNMPLVLNNLDPTKGWHGQLAIIVASWLAEAILMAVIALIAVQALYAESPAPESNWRRDMGLGASLGLVIATLGTLLYFFTVNAFEPSQFPHIATDWPVLAAVGSALTGFRNALFIMVIAVGLTRFVHDGRLWRWWLIIAVTIAWLVFQIIAAGDWQTGLSQHIGAPVTLLVSLHLLARGQLGAALALQGVVIALDQLSLLGANHSLGWLQAVSAAAVCLVVAVFLVRHWHKHCHRPVPGQDTTSGEGITVP